MGWSHGTTWRRFSSGGTYRGDGGDRGHSQSPTHPLCAPHSESPAWQVAFVRNGCLSLLYNCLPTCPPPVLRWLFQVRPLSLPGVPSSPATLSPLYLSPSLFWQLMTLCPDTTNAAQTLWDIWLSTEGERGGWLPQWGDVPKPLPIVTVPLPTGERWCPTMQEISEAFTRLGADLTPLLPPELHPTDGR